MLKNDTLRNGTSRKEEGKISDWFIAPSASLTNNRLSQSEQAKLRGKTCLFTFEIERRLKSVGQSKAILFFISLGIVNFKVLFSSQEVKVQSYRLNRNTGINFIQNHPPPGTRLERSKTSSELRFHRFDHIFDQAQFWSHFKFSLVLIQRNVQTEQLSGKGDHAVPH